MDCCIVPPNSRTCHQLQLNRLRDLAVATATCLLGYNEWYVKGGGQQQRPGKAEPLVGKEEGGEKEAEHQRIGTGSSAFRWPAGVLVRCQALSVVSRWMCHPPNYGRQWFDGASRMWPGGHQHLCLWEREGIVFHHCRISHRAEPNFSKKSWVWSGDQDGGSGGHLLVRGRGKWEKRPLETCKIYFLIKISLESFYTICESESLLNNF